jgi:hypothetical protein
MNIRSGKLHTFRFFFYRKKVFVNRKRKLTKKSALQAGSPEGLGRGETGGRAYGEYVVILL